MTGRYFRDPCVAHLAPWMRVQGARLHPDRGMAERFLRRLDPVAERFSFRTFSATGYTLAGAVDPLEQDIHGALDACWGQLVRLNRAGAAVSVTVNQTHGLGRAVSDIVRVRAIFLDDDRGGDPGRFPLPPHLRVATSPGHSHYYWMVDGVPLEAFAHYQRRLAERYLGDSRVLALNQSMQLPGFWRRKQLTQPFPTRFVTLYNGPDYRPDELVSRLFTAESNQIEY